MGLKCKHRTGDVWVLPEGRFVYMMELPGGDMLFRKEKVDETEREATLIRSEARIEELQAERKARRERSHRDADGSIQRSDAADEIGPDNDDPYAGTLRFYLRKWDAQPCSKSVAAFKTFVAAHAPEAARKGLFWRPSPGALARAIKGRGEVGRRPLRVMQSMRGKVARQHWPAVTAEALRRTVAWFYAKRERDVGDAHVRLVRLMAKLNDRGRRRLGDAWRDLCVPSDETVRLRIRGAESLETLTAKFGATEARRRWKGTARGLQAKQILDVVMIDATTLDGWCVLDDRYGDLIPVGRPTVTIAIDLWSRTILGVVITYEGETLCGIATCIQQVVTGKHAIIERLPHFRNLLEDLHGRPDTLVVDNAWRQTGVSMQDACEDVGINVEWAPVRNPEWKAHIESFWKTLNKLLVHKLPGGVPFGVDMMRKLGLKPEKTATLTLSELEALIYEAIHAVYHGEPHSGTMMAPLVAWRKGLIGGRETIDDVDFLAAAIGTVKEGTLDRQGIRFRNCRFHDKDITTQLLADLAPHAPMRGRRKRLGSASVKVKFKYIDADLTRIGVWNPHAKPSARYVSLPNWDSAYSSAPGLGFWHHDRVKDWADANNLEFKTDKERAFARDHLRAATENAAPEAKAAAMRTRRRLLEGSKPLLRAGTDTVVFKDARPGVNARKPYDLPVETAAHRRSDGGIPEKGPRRGGKRRVAAKARRPPQTEREPVNVEPGPSARPAPARRPLGRAPAKAEAAGLMVDLMRRMSGSQTNSNGGRR